MRPAPSKAELQVRPAVAGSTAVPMPLDRRDIQTLMYCVRIAEVHGQWQAGYPVRSPNDLECKLAALLAELDRDEAMAATPSRAA